MKNAIFTVIMITLLIATAPMISLVVNHDENKTIQSNATISSSFKTQDKTTQNSDSTKKEKPTEKAPTKEVKNISSDYTFKIYDKSKNKIIAVSDYDFICGALATEIETDIPKEAIKAQAVAIHTYYSYLRDISRTEKNEHDFECNSKIWEVYVSKDEIKEKWGDTYEESYNIICNAVNEVKNTFVLYDNKLCMTKYFKISSGITNSYKEFYGEDIPYLTSIPSPFDTLANNYKTKTEYTKEEFDTAVKESFPSYKSADDTNKNISDISKNDNGTVANIKAGNIKTTGKKLADILNLRSSCFEIICSDTGYTFTTYGHGENIGMSQFGACKLAEQGSSYIEILQYYYPNTIISDSFKPI